MENARWQMLGVKSGRKKKEKLWGTPKRVPQSFL